MATGHRTLRLLLAAIAFVGVAHAQMRPPLVVTLTRPRGGVHDGGFGAMVEATVSDRSVRRAWLTANGLSREVPVTDGRVRESVLALPGTNRISLTATRGGFSARDALTFYARGVEAELVVWVTWPRETAGVRHLDLSDSAWERCRRFDPCIDSWGRCADRPVSDCDRMLVGPPWEQVARPSRGSRAERLPRVGAPWFGYVIRTAHAGRYTIRSAEEIFPEDRPPERDDVTSLLAQLDAPLLPATPARRADLLTHLDRAAAPLATATPVRILVVLLPGTSQERRWIFDGVFSPYRTGSPLAVVEVNEPELRAARGARP